MSCTDNEAIEFDDLLSKEFDFYGCDGLRFRLDNVVYEVIADDDSASFDEIRISQDDRGFFDLPIARVTIENSTFNDEGYELIDLHDGHCWLRFGTEVEDIHERVYITQFVFEYEPRGPGD